MFARLFQNRSQPISWLLVGLGNVGPQYAGHRHNIGFMLADTLASQHQAPAWRSKFHGSFTTFTMANQQVGLLKPHTLMNRSGQAVQAAAAFYKIKPEQIVVVHDELDLPFGELRCKQGGGDAGHNGLKDISQKLGRDYHRVRIGIGHPGDKAKVSGYVLSDFSKAEQAELAGVLDAAAKHISTLISG